MDAKAPNLMDARHIYFSGESNCPNFSANAFKKDVCSNCQQKLQSHSGATESEIKAALEFSVDNGK